MKIIPDILIEGDAMSFIDAMAYWLSQIVRKVIELKIILIVQVMHRKRRIKKRQGNDD